VEPQPFLAKRTEVTTIKNDVMKQVSDLSAQVLVNEEVITKLNNNFDLNKQYMTSNAKPAIKKVEKLESNGVMDILTLQLLEKITSNETAISEMKDVLATIDHNNNNHNELDKTFNFKLDGTDITEIAKHVQNLDGDDSPLAKVKSTVMQAEKSISDLSKTESEFRNRVQKIEQYIAGFKIEQHIADYLKHNQTNNNNNNTPDKNSSNNKPRNTPAENETLDHDVVIIGDSNTKNIDMKTVGRGTSRKRFTCYTIPQTINFINTANIITPPKKIVLHLGTNHVKNVETTIEQLQLEFDELIALAQTRFPTARIYISSVFCRMRKEDVQNKVIKMLNNYLSEFCDKTPGFTLVDNSNIHHKDMKDPLHVNSTGFHTFICNLRVTVFGEKHNLRR
jgi:hypothetical protein